MMRRLFLHLLVALLAFFVGVTAAMLLGHMPVRPPKYRRAANAVYVVPDGEAPPRRFACPGARERESRMTPLRSMPMITESPQPPASVEGRRAVRIRIRRADGSVEVVEKSHPAERTKF